MIFKAAAFGATLAPLARALHVLLLLAVGCQCSDNAKTKHDAGSTDSSADTDADTDSDTDSDSETESDSCPGVEVDVALDPTLEWEPIPEGMECGVGCQQLTGTGSTHKFDVWGDWVVAMESVGSSSPLITLVDVPSSTRTLLDHGFQTIDFATGHPSLYAGEYFYVLFENNNDGAIHYAWGTSEDKGYKLLEPCKGSLYELDSWGKWLAYAFESNTPGMQDLYLLDRETLERKSVTSFGGVIEITLSGDWVTFTRVDGNVEIYAYNVVTEELKNISDHPSDQFNSRNDGPHVVWTDLRSNSEAEYFDLNSYGAADIYYYNIETQELRQITDENGIQLNPDIHGDWIVWQDWRECPNPNYYYSLCFRTWGYNLVTEEERKISEVGAERPRIWGDKVYFKARYQEDPPQAAVCVQDLNQLPDADAGPDGGK